MPRVLKYLERSGFEGKMESRGVAWAGSFHWCSGSGVVCMLNSNQLKSKYSMVCMIEGPL